jgi:hypothetical protein
MSKQAKEDPKEETQGEKDETLLTRIRRTQRISSHLSAKKISLAMRYWLQKEIDP